GPAGAGGRIGRVDLLGQLLFELAQSGSLRAGDRKVDLEVVAADLMDVLLVVQIFQQQVRQQRRGHRVGASEVHLELDAHRALVHELGGVQEGLEQIEVPAQDAPIPCALRAGVLGAADLASHGGPPGDGGMMCAHPSTPAPCAGRRAAGRNGRSACRRSPRREEGGASRSTVAPRSRQEYRGGTIRSAKEPVMSQLASRYDHVIIGGGVAADAAARALRAAAPEASIALLSADPHSPVYRPALSKDLWHGESADPDSQDLRTAEDTGAELFTGILVTELGPRSHSVVTARGEVIHYGTALLAMGSSARRFPGVHDARVATLRTVGDYRHLRALAQEGARIVVVGGGY